MKKYILYLIILILLSIVANTEGYSDSENYWSRVPQIDGTFKLISEIEAKQLYLKEYPARGRSIKIDFHLYTRLNPNKSQKIHINDVEGLKNSNYNSNYQTRFIIHGWRNDYNSSVNNIIRGAYLEYSNLNIFVVDWSSAAKTINYYTARYSVEDVGKFIAKFLAFLHKHGRMSYINLKLIGHSLGAHCAGYAGKYIENNSKIHTIIGLDPAMPLFWYNKPSERLNSTDASYVETIHTNGGKLGFYEPIGKASFFPNWGKTQPGCGFDLTGQCSHERAYQLFSEAIIKNQFVAIKCKNYINFANKNCSIVVKNLKMGNHMNYVKAKGIYYVPTNSEQPFGNGIIKLK